MRVAIAGAGLGGLCLAQALRGAGIEADVYERDPAITARFQGYRLVLDPVGFQALRSCLPRRWHPLLDAVVSDAYVERLVLDAQLNKIGELGPVRSGIVVDRHVLRHLLLTGLTVHTGAALTGYDVLDNGRVEARFADRDPAIADLLVGADGVGSAVRQVLTPRTTPTDTGVRFVIGRTPLTEQFAGLSRAYGGKIVGDGASLLLGAMRFPIPPKEAAEKLAPEVTLPDIHDYVRWAMVLPPNGSRPARCRPAGPLPHGGRPGPSRSSRRGRRLRAADVPVRGRGRAPQPRRATRLDGNNRYDVRYLPGGDHADDRAQGGDARGGGRAEGDHQDDERDDEADEFGRLRDR